MFYLRVKQTIPIYGIEKPREIVTISNREYFIDMQDKFPSSIPENLLVSEENFSEFLKHGYKTEVELQNNRKMINAINEFIGPFAKKEFSIVTEEELKQEYKMMEEELRQEYKMELESSQKENQEPEEERNMEDDV